MFLISASLTVYSLQTYRMKKEGHSYAYRDFCSHQEGVWGNGFSDVSWLNFPSWKLPIKAHKIYESAQSNRSFTFYRFCVFLANWRMPWRRAPSASRWMNRRIISISSTSSRSWISWRASVIPWLLLCMTWISQRCIVIDWSRYRVGRWSAWGRRRSSWHRILSRSSMMWTVRSTMGRMKGWISSIFRSIGRNDIVLQYSKEPC